MAKKKATIADGENKKIKAAAKKAKAKNPLNVGKQFKKYLDPKEVKKIKKFNNMTAKGKELTPQQQQRYSELQQKYEAGKQFSYSENAKEIAAEKQAADVQAEQALKYGNVNVAGPMGSSTVTVDPVTGQAKQEIQLSGGQQKILDQGEGLTQLGQQLAQQQLQGYTPYGSQDLSGDRQRIENEVFNRLTRNVERDYGREKDQLEQTLYNRGIPLDPSNPQYKQHMQALNERYDTFKQDAMARAVEMGGQEYQRSHGIGLGTHQQGMADISALQQQGIGLQLPNFAAPQGAGYAFQSPSGLQSIAQNIQSMQAADKLGQDSLAVQKQLGMGNLAVAQGQLSLAQQQAANAAKPPGPPIEGV